MRKGFTLIEILVAMSILGVIMLVMAQVFMASNTAWTGGLRQVEMSMEGRAAISLIATELAQAMADDRLPVTMTANSLNFYTATDPAAAIRSVKRVHYTASGGEVRREVTPIGAFAGGGYPVEGAASGVIPLVGSVTGFAVGVPTGWVSGSQLPNWVDLRLTLEAESGQTSVRVWSSGPPDGDDITTWR